ncbi:MAG: hypothetical protein JWQ71_2778, partial [Pedosphaera sp.]|nr:hypothetical protein [Pedosphaera sp.]
MRALLCLCIFMPLLCAAQIYDTNNVNVQTFVGSGFSGLVDGNGTQNMFNNPKAIIADLSSNIFVLDKGNSVIRKVTPAGDVTTFENSGVLQNYNYYLDRLSIDSLGTLWTTTDYWANFIQVYPDRNYNVLSMKAYNPAIQSAYGFCVDSHKNKYFTDSLANKIYLWDTNGVISVFAGSGNSGNIDGNGIFTSFNGPTSITIDAADNLYVWDSYNQLIRRITRSRDVITIAGALQQYGDPQDRDGVGTGAIISTVENMAVDASGNLILTCGRCVRKISQDLAVTTIAG